MVNRILIRVKVVQILYSYLIARNEFKIDLPLENPSRDRRFGYAVYLDALNLIQELSGIKTNHPDRSLRAIDVHPRLKSNRVGRALADNPQLREITFKNLGNLNAFSPILQKLSDTLTAQSVFQDYLKKRTRTLDDDIALWTTLLETTFLKNPEVNAALRGNPDFSLTGLHYGVMQAVATLKAFNDSRIAYDTAKKVLADSLEKSHQLYMALFVLIAELTQEERDRIEFAKEKVFASAEELNPNTKFIDNKFVQKFVELPEYQEFIKETKFTWLDSPTLLSSLLDDIFASKAYAKYMASPESTWEGDCDFWRDILRNVVFPSEALDTAMEEKSIYWNDDLNTIGDFVLKTIRKFAASENGNGVDFMEKFKDKEDEDFGAELFTIAVEKREEYREYIDRFITSDWDPGRLAFMDIVVMTVAIAEMLNFPSIPLPVTFNEYVEIANTYSTRRSGPFINGILYSVAKYLIDEGILHKPLARDKEKTEN